MSSQKKKKKNSLKSNFFKQDIMLPEEDKTAKSFSCLYRACKSVVWTRYSVFEQVQVIIRVHVGLSYLEGSYILFL